MDARELLLHIDACRPGDASRPGGGDLQDAEMAPLAAAMARDRAARELYDRVQAADAKIGAAVRGAHAIPQGLEARLLAAVQEAAARDDVLPSSDQGSAAGVTAARTVVRAGAATAGSIGRAVPPARFSWRRAMVGTSLVAAVVALAVYVMNLPRPITADEVVEEVRQVYDKEFARATNWNEAPNANRASADFEIPFDALREGEKYTRGVVPWREFTFDNSDAVVYDLFRGATAERLAELARMEVQGIPVIRKAALFVIERRVYGLPTAPPSVPQGQTDGPCIGVWRSEDMIYALAVEGGMNVEDRIILYQGLIESSGLARRFAAQAPNANRSSRP